jgi:hypothetical protein
MTERFTIQGVVFESVTAPDDLVQRLYDAQDAYDAACNEIPRPSDDVLDKFATAMTAAYHACLAAGHPEDCRYRKVRAVG